MAFCTATGGSVSSWGRTEKHNKAVGGVPGSLHRVWLAVDVVYDLPVLTVRAEQVAASLGIRLIREGDHDHLQAKRE